MVKPGSKWVSSEGKAFRVIHRIQLDGNVWIHYRCDTDSKEYSCYEDSFVGRFRLLAE